MRICYLLETTDLCGGVRIVFDQSRVLRKRGHEITMRALRGDHHWYPYPVDVEYVNDLSAGFPENRGCDVVIATFWTTVLPALKVQAPAKFHLCQGYEGDSKEYDGIRGDIEAAYMAPIPKLTIGDWISARLKGRFGSDHFPIFCVGQIVDLDLFTPPSFLYRFNLKRYAEEAKILVSGLFEASVKAIPDALRAVALLREQGLPVHLTRVSATEVSDAESEFTRVDEAYSRIHPKAMARLYQRSDMYIAPSLAHEGFGLPFAEALACGVPSVATAIPSHLSFDETADYALFVPERDPHAIAASASRIMRDTALQKHLRKRGVEVVRKKFRSERVADRLEAAFREFLQ